MRALREVLNRWETELEGEAWNSLYWNNHDQPRVVSRFGDDSPRWRERSAKMLATCLHMMKGTPYVYQGEEIGMTGKHFESLEECRDVEEINIWRQAVEEQHVLTPQQMLECFDHVARDNSRTPMQWDATDYAGFSTKEPWIAVNPNYTTINVQKNLADPNSVYHYYKRLIELRHTMDIIVYGTYIPLLTESDAVWAYQRELDGQVLTVACNWTDKDQPVDLFGPEDEYVIGNVRDHTDGVLKPYEAYVTLRKA